MSTLGGILAFLDARDDLDLFSKKGNQITFGIWRPNWVNYQPGQLTLTSTGKMRLSFELAKAPVSWMPMFAEHAPLYENPTYVQVRWKSCGDRTCRRVYWELRCEKFPERYGEIQGVLAPFFYRVDACTEAFYWKQVALDNQELLN